MVQRVMTKMRTILAALLLFSGFAMGQTDAMIRYVVQLEGQPAILANDRQARTAEIRGEQQAFSRALTAIRGARAVATMATTVNAVVVEAPAGQLALLSSFPGVRRVEEVFNLELHTNRIPALHQVPSLWSAVGGASNAGRGMKVAILDTGVEHSHPAFRDPGLPMPDGFPQISSEVNRALTNNKVIVARSFDGIDARDEVGHGTAVAMVAAGVVHDSPRGVISGVAPGAWIGNYRVNIAGSRSIPTDFAMRGFEAAVDDGMNVINMSFGSNGLTGSVSDILAEQARLAADRGIIVVQSAGNSGPEIMTVDDTSADSKVLSVGANQPNTTTAILLPEGAPIANVAASSNAPLGGAFSGQLFDVVRIDPSGLFCGGAPPAGSLTGTIPLIQRGDCNFTVKLRNSFLGGAAAAIIYNSANPAAGTPDDVFVADVAADPTIPAATIGRSDGLRLRAAAAASEEYQVVVRFSGEMRDYQIAGFSSLGPSVDLTIKPDLVATGASVYTAAQTRFPGQSLYSETGYITTQGTSFSAPVVAGAAAALMGARPWLDASEYRSMLVHSAEPLRLPDGKAVGVMSAGAGTLNVERALQSTISAYPLSVSFGAQGSTVKDWRQVILRNLSNTTVTYELSIESEDRVLPQLTANRVTLGPGEIAGPVLIFAEGGLAPGAYQGFLRINDPEHNTTARVPYWMAVRSTQPARISLPLAPTSARAGTVVNAFIRVHDAAGVPITDAPPQITVELGTGIIQSFFLEPQTPGAWRLRLLLGPGANRVRVDAGALSRTFTINGTL